MSNIKLLNGYTIVEVMVVVIILAIMATSSLVFLSSGNHKARVRDGQRKKDISDIAEALGFYLTATDGFPTEGGCDTSVGTFNSPCIPLPGPAQNNWDTATSSSIYDALINMQQVLKKLPTDPINNLTYFYYYEPSSGGEGTCPAGSPPCAYWIGATLEKPKDPTRPIFRCSDVTGLAGGPPGCIEVQSLGI